MNVLYISYDGALDQLGSSQIIPHISRLSRQGFKFTLLTYEKKERLSDTAAVKILKEKLCKERIKWEIVPYHKSPIVPATIFDIMVGLFKGAIIVFRDKIKLIHARSFIGAIPAFILSKTFKCGFIFDMRGLWAEEKVDAGDWKKGGCIYKVVKVMEKMFFKYSDSVVVLTNSGEELLKNKFGLNSNLTVIPTCTDLNLFNLREGDSNRKLGEIKDSRTVFVYFGSVGSWYMLEEMIDFFISSRPYFDKPLFLLLNRTDHNLITEMMLRKNISNDDYLIKSLNYCSVSGWLNTSHMSLFFIKPVLSKIMSCPTKFGESLACGIPVIINRGIGDTEKIVKSERVGVVVEEFSPESYVKAAAELKKLLDEGEELRMRCRFIAGKYFSLESAVKQYKEIYEVFLRK